VTLASSTPGIRLQLDGQPFTAPQSHIGVVGVQREIAAPSPQIVGGRIYLFQGWSDGGAATHTISTPAADKTYVARFRELIPLPGGPTVAAADPLVVELGAPKRAHRRLASGRGIPVRVEAPASTRAVVSLRRGARRLARRSVTVDADGVRVVRLKVKPRRLAAIASRRVLRIVVAASGADGQTAQASRRILLTG
jgi:hypothetical protein